MPSKDKGVILVLVTALISGVSIFLNKLAVTGFNPYLFTGSKNALVTFFLFLLLARGKQLTVFKRLSFREWFSLFLVGLVGGSLPFLLFFKGLSQTSSANAAFIHKNLFVFVAFLAPIFLAEKPKKKFFGAAGLLLLGNAFLLKIFSLHFQKGDFLIFLATFLWAWENILSKKLLEELAPQVVAFGRMFFGSVLIGLFLAFNRSFLAIDAFGLVQLNWLFLTSLFLLGYVTTWYVGLKRAPASVASSVLVLGSPITTLLSLAFLGLIPDFRQVLGMVLLAFGMMVLLWRDRVCPCSA